MHASPARFSYFSCSFVLFQSLTSDKLEPLIVGCSGELASVSEMLVLLVQGGSGVQATESTARMCNGRTTIYVQFD